MALKRVLQRLLSLDTCLDKWRHVAASAMLALQGALVLDRNQLRYVVHKIRVSANGSQDMAFLSVP